MKVSAKRLRGFSTARGLIGYDKLFPVGLETRFGIHTFGLKSPIDVIILNKKNEAICFKKNLLPNRIFLWNPRFKNVLELPQGFIEKNGIKRGQKIEVNYSQ